MKIKQVIDNKLCLGCGLCQSLYPNKCTMEIGSNGFYYPKFNEKLNKNEDKDLSLLCPSIYVNGNGNTGEWGAIKELNESWASNDDVRHHAASGGVTTAIALFLLEHNHVDAILQVGKNDDSYLYNSLKISTTSDDIKNCSQSRYAPALVFDKILQIIEKNPQKTYAFIGKPCDVAAIRNLQAKYPIFKRQIKICISIFCAGMPSYNATIKTWQLSGRREEPMSLQYRGDGWPGYFTARWADGNEYRLSYNDSWGKILGRSLGLRCKVCPDGIGELADIAIGDSWKTKNGFPDFTEQPGRCFVMVRTNLGHEIYHDAVTSGYIVSKQLNLKDIAIMQPYQAQRRKLTLWRLAPLQLKTKFLLKFNNLGIIKLGLSAGFIKGMRTFIGSCRRIFKNG